MSVDPVGSGPPPALLDSHWIPASSPCQFYPTDRCAKKVKLFPVVVFELRARGSMNSPEKQGFSGERDMATPSTSSLKT